MVTQVGNILKGYIENLPFIDKVAGVVRTASYKSQDGTKTVKEPVACTTSNDECKAGTHVSLAPDSSKKSVLFIKDRGARFIAKEGAVYKWRASYDICCWLNLPALGFSDCSYSGIAIMAILSALPASPIPSNGIYSRINIIPGGQAPKSQNPYGEYTFDETITQYLMSPFDYFILTVDVEFYVDKRCLTAAAVQPLIPCK